MYHDRASSDRRGRIVVIATAHFIVINEPIAIGHGPDLDSEQIHVCAGCELGIDDSKYETEFSSSIDRTGSLVLGTGVGHHEADRLKPMVGEEEGVCVQGRVESNFCPSFIGVAPFPWSCGTPT